MSLGIAFKGPEGIVLAADSRVTIMAEVVEGSERRLVPSTFDNATKLLKIEGYRNVGAVTYGAGAFGRPWPRTAHSYMPEFERELRESKGLSVERFAQKLGDFFLKQWQSTMPNEGQSKVQDMVFLVGGFDKNEPYGSVFEVRIPSRPEPVEWHKVAFGAVWGGQREFTDRLIQGFDPRLETYVKRRFDVTSEDWKTIEQELKEELGVGIPYPFLPLQDCVDLAIFLIRATIAMQSFLIGIRGVGGAIDVATITRVSGFSPIQSKNLHGEYTAKGESCAPPTGR